MLIECKECDGIGHYDSTPINSPSASRYHECSACKGTGKIETDEYEDEENE